MNYALTEIKRIIEVVTKEGNWEENENFFKEIEEIIEEEKIRKGSESFVEGEIQKWKRKFIILQQVVTWTTKD